MSKNLAAVLGTGQTKYVAKRHDVSMNGLVREAIDKALRDSNSTMTDIDAIVVGKAPDFFEGVMMPELFMADAVGASGKVGAAFVRLWRQVVHCEKVRRPCMAGMPRAAVVANRSR